jgi:hypothetical protein
VSDRVGGAESAGGFGSAGLNQAFSRLLMLSGARFKGVGVVPAKARRNDLARPGNSLPGSASQTSSTSRWYSASFTMRCASMPSPNSACSRVLMRWATTKHRSLSMIRLVWACTPTMRHPQENRSCKRPVPA